MSLSTSTVAVVAHNQKTLGGGLGQLRDVLAANGVTDPLWYEVPKSRYAPARIGEARAGGADLIFIWGGDGMMQRSVDTLAGTDITIAILPAGTANLLATNLGVPKDLEQAVEIGLHGVDLRLDAGRINGEHFAVMAGTGLDALMIRDADRGLKDRFGRAAYVWTGARNVRHRLTRTKIVIDGNLWFDDDASCVLVGNVSDISGGITAFDDASPTDGRLDVAVMTASGAIQWARVLTRAAVGTTEKSPLVQMTTAKRIDVKMKKAMPYELDGGARKKTKHLKIKVVPSAVTIRVPTPPTPDEE
jgi:YegS/Rv2252/BmrU family lipid kinase